MLWEKTIHRREKLSLELFPLFAVSGAAVTPPTCQCPCPGGISLYQNENSLFCHSNSPPRDIQVGLLILPDDKISIKRHWPLRFPWWSETPVVRHSATNTTNCTVAKSKSSEVPFWWWTSPSNHISTFSLPGEEFFIDQCNVSMDEFNSESIIQLLGH